MAAFAVMVSGFVFAGCGNGVSLLLTTEKNDSLVYAASMADHKYGYGIGEDGLATYTEDSGKTWQLSGQYFIDQLLFGGERPEDTGEAASIVLLNASKTSRLGSGILDYYVEVVYGNPYVYLKNTHGYGISDAGSDNHYYDVNTYREAKAYQAVDLISDQIIDRNNGTAQDVQYLGYKYGGDVFVLATGAKYSLENLKLNFGIRAGESRLSEGRADYCSEKFNNVIQHTLIAGFGVNWTFAKGIEISASAAGLANINYHHVASPIAFDYQYSVGVNIHVLDFFNIRKPL